MIDELNKMVRVCNLEEIYQEELAEDAARRNRYYETKVLPKALKYLPPEFAERFTASNSLFGWKVENVTIDGLFHKLQVDLSQIRQPQGVQENIVMEFTVIFPFQMRTAEEMYASVEDDPYKEGCDLIDGFKFEKLPGRKRRIACSILFQSGAMISFAFKGMEFSYSEHVISSDEAKE